MASPVSRLCLTLCLTSAVQCGQANAAAPPDDYLNVCGPIANAYGPFDYRTQRNMLAIVEQYHFTPLVENLIKPMFQYFGPDLDYTLRASPNHHRALVTLTRLSIREGTDQPKGSPRTVDCYFDRGMRFAPDDLLVRLIYADWLNKVKRSADAVRQLDWAANRAADNPFTRYNLGLLYFDARAYDKSLEQAHLAMNLGYTRTDLKDKLAGVGKWTEPVSPAGPGASAPAGTSSGASR